MIRKILFLHGFFASGSCLPALTLEQCFSGKAQVLAPDLPLHPQEALLFIDQVCKLEKPDILVGNSNGAFLGQMVAARRGMPALLGNPHFEMTKFLSQRLGVHKYKSPRTDGKQQLIIDLPLIDEFAALQQRQWDQMQSANKELVWGLFGENDQLAHYESLFLKHYMHAYHFPGGHTPTAQEVKDYYAPLATRLLESIQQPTK